MEYTMIGELTQINDTVRITSTFSKKEIIVSEGEGPNSGFAIFELLDKKISKIEQFKVGDGVRIRFKVQGRKYTTKNGGVKYFNNLLVTEIEAYTIVKVNSTSLPVTSFDTLK